MTTATRKILLGLTAALPIALNACGARGHLAARAGAQVLTADRVAEILDRWGRSSQDTAVARRIAEWWVEYQLFAERVVVGDSMLDSATVLDVLWTEARAYVLARWREQLFASQLPLDSAALDGVYQGGDYRFIQHVLFQAPERGPPEARARAEQRAQVLRERLVRGLSWESAQQHSDDVNARRQGGSVGVITRGQTEPEFERAAFALEPGGVSGVVASSYGYHIARRPPLREVRAQFRSAVEPLIAQHLDSLHMRTLGERWRLELRPDGMERAREAVRRPLRYKDSPTVIAAFDGGQFTQQDLVRWLEAVPDLVHSEVERGGEQPLSAFLDMMMRYELLYREALRNGVNVSTDEFTTLRHQLAERLTELQALLNVYPPAPGDSASAEELRRRAAQRVDQFLLTRPDDWQRFARVPARLVDRLKRGTQWAVYPRGIEQGVRLLEQRRADTLSNAVSGSSRRSPGQSTP